MTLADILQRRFAIEVGSGGLVAVRDTLGTSLAARAPLGTRVYSTATREEADAILAQHCARSVEGDGWILRRYWAGSVRDEAELARALERTHADIRREALRTGS